MDNISRWPANDRADLFQEASAQLGISLAVIEKDFWVCWLLKMFFADEILGGKILLKGGTSLSKAFGLIKRFSEDIDLVLNWNEVVKEDPYQERSKTKQDRFNKTVCSRTREYLKDAFLPATQKLVSGVCEAFIYDSAPDIIAVQYPNSFKQPYLRNEIQLEVGPLAAWMPNDFFAIKPYAAEMIPKVFRDSTATIRAIKAERSFWEKATILHQEAHRPIAKPQPVRYSRQYYDLAMIAKTDVAKRALEDRQLLRRVVEFKRKFYPSGWAHYEMACPGTFRLLPPVHVFQFLERDYKDMRIMIFGEAPALDQIMKDIKELEEKINKPARNF
jgi:hypothetical protein